ncbi:Putative Zinc finger, RING-type [Septoria linicola]|uniref:Zinc finger, RING-type n=1 Tax=Septoria linicola TaxID=215465 RepID=A0A9Q9AZ23_9PEZI|nr:Putative Zinc finger, RING-type [Septoria linicola]
MSGNEGYSAAEGRSRKRMKTSRTGRRDVSNGSASPIMAFKSETPIKVEAGLSGGVVLPKMEPEEQQQNGQHVHNGTCHHEQSLHTIHADMDAMRQLITCKMCYRFLYEPYGLSCGHTYCYSCLAQWMGNSKTCPDCRARVTQQPTPTFVIREMVRVFVAKSELLPDGETSEEHEKMAREEAEIIAKDKANQDTDTGGLFRGRFTKGSRFHPVPAFRDEGDGVWRCPSCMIEVEDGRCRHCNMRVHVDGETDNDSTLTDSDDEIDGSLQDMDHDHDVDLGLDIGGAFGSEGFGDGSSDIDHDFYDHPVHNLDGGPPDHHMHHIFDSEDDSDESGGSMDGFIDEDVHYDDDATIDESDNEAESTPARPSASQQRRRPVLSDSDDDEDAEEMTGPQRRVVPHYQRFDDTSSAIASRTSDGEDESDDNEPISSNNQRHARRLRTITIDSDDEGDSSDAPPEEGQVDFSNYQAFSPAHTDDSNPVNLISDDDAPVRDSRQDESGGYDGARDSENEDSSFDDDDDDTTTGLGTSTAAQPYDYYDDEEDGEEQESDDSDEPSMTNGWA